MPALAAAATPPLPVVRPVVVAVADVPGSIVVDVPVMRDTMMLVTNMMGGVVAAVLSLGGGRSGDRRGSSER